MSGSARVPNRWIILAILFSARFAMSFQFQSVAAVTPLLRSQFGIGLAEIGFLIGLYFPFGVILALPGGAVGRWFGDRGTVLIALCLMLAGELVTAFGNSWTSQIAGRLIAGAGGVLLNVQLTKMLTDWFAVKEIATAMAVFVNSWPAGVALALIALPAIGSGYGLTAIHLTVSALIVAAIFIILAYRSPVRDNIATAASHGRLDSKTIAAVVVAGLIWGCFNIGLAMIFSFGPSLLAEHGWSISRAGSTISIVLWLGILSAPVGGLLSDRLKRPRMMLAAGCLLSAAFALALAYSSDVLLAVVVLGLTIGLAPGAIMSLPARVLGPSTRAIGMGIFYMLYYGAMTVGPIIGGARAKWHDSATAAFDVGAFALLLCPLLLLLFNWIISPRRAFGRRSMQNIAQTANPTA
jgi:MFS family permease